MFLNTICTNICEKNNFKKCVLNFSRIHMPFKVALVGGKRENDNIKGEKVKFKSD